MPVRAERAYDWHAAAAERLVPPWWRLHPVESPRPIREGGRGVVELRVGPVRLRWNLLHDDVRPGRSFRERLVEGPVPEWLHVHRFVPDGDEACWIEDRVDYVLPLGRLGRRLGEGPVQRALSRAFAYRHWVAREDLGRVADRHGSVPLSIAISGASGLVGRQLAAALGAAGHRVLRLVRGEPAAEGESRWDPASGALQAEALEGLDAVIHLAGASLADRRWNEARKREILESRVRGTDLLCRTLASLRSPPRTLISASAVGFYGDRADEPVDETSPPGRGFLADVCRAWEAAAEPARARGIRVVPLRLGVVLTARGGALPRMLTPFRLGLGGRIGSGHPYVSWIALEDVIAAVEHVLATPQLDGPINLVAPAPVRGRELARTLGRVLRRPARLPVPATVVRAGLGEMGDALLLQGAQVSSRRLQESGFRFRFPDLESALRFELGRAPELSS